ncbi:MAG: septum formation initiator family protein [Clostridia bacterium]|nr:septum formation initiator family protein [Clostridia bacterium]
MTIYTKRKLIAVLACLVVFAVGMLVWIGVLSAKDKELDDEIADKQAQLEELTEENAILDALIDEDNVTALMEEYARDEGYIYPDERVYIEE